MKCFNSFSNTIFEQIFFNYTFALFEKQLIRITTKSLRKVKVFGSQPRIFRHMDGSTVIFLRILFFSHLSNPYKKMKRKINFFLYTT